MCTGHFLFHYWTALWHKLPFAIGGLQINVAIVVLALVTIYYISLSKTLWIGLLMFAVLCIWLCGLIETANVMQLWLISIIVFVVAWVGQFYGHKVEGKTFLLKRHPVFNDWPGLADEFYL